MAKRAEAFEQRSPLSAERVFSTAIRLADKGGIEKLTMRHLAGSLRVEAMSLYYYVKSKDELLDAMIDMVVREIELPKGASWKSALRKSANSFHAVLARHPWAAGLLMSPKRVGLSRVRYMDAVLTCLREAGFSPVLTHYAYHALDSHILGSTLWAAGYSADKVGPDFGRALLQRIPAGHVSAYFFEHAEQHVKRSVGAGRSAFEFGLDIILDGVERMPNEAPATRSSVASRSTAKAPGRLTARRRDSR